MALRYQHEGVLRTYLRAAGKAILGLPSRQLNPVRRLRPSDQALLVGRSGKLNNFSWHRFLDTVVELSFGRNSGSSRKGS